MLLLRLPSYVKGILGSAIKKVLFELWLGVLGDQGRLSKCSYQPECGAFDGVTLVYPVHNIIDQDCPYLLLFSPRLSLAPPPL